MFRQGMTNKLKVVKSTPSTFEASIRRFGEGNVHFQLDDALAVEEPLEIRLGFPDGSHKAISITMRTPGDDAELAAGFLFTEGIVRHPHQIERIRHCGLKLGRASSAIQRAAALNSNTIRVDLRDGVSVDLKRLERHFYTSSSCGVCGKGSIEALSSISDGISSDNVLRVKAEVINRLPATLISAQETFERTGGLHASGLFDVDGRLEMIREDVGRHNALDKVIGAKFLNSELPLSETMLLVSGRLSFELVQKALMAGIPIIAAVGAPSSLAVELASEMNMTLVGFVRDSRFNVYCGTERIIS